MLNLVDVIDPIYDEHYLSYVDKPHFTEDGVDFIRSVLACDRLLNTIGSFEYDAILVTNKDQPKPELGQRFMGDVFFDKKERFSDGLFIITGTVKDIIPYFSEITLVKTSRSNYLVIQ